jgi:hypothetical protein
VYSRRLGVIEAMRAAADQCPSGAVRTCAANALEAVKREGASALPTQAFLVLTAIRGWSGERAEQVRSSLQAFLDEAEAGD